MPAASVPGVTIIRPLCGLDNNMFNTLESMMRLDYPNYEVIFALQDPNDEALPVVRMVMEKNPDVDARVIISEFPHPRHMIQRSPEGRWKRFTSLKGIADRVDPEKVGVNPKVNNLMAPFREAKHDLLWVVDATIAVTPGVLGRMVEAFLDSPDQSTNINDVESHPLIADEERPPPTAGQVGLVHQVPYAVVYEKTWGSLIEQAYLNSTHAKMYLSIVSGTKTGTAVDSSGADIQNAVAIESCVVGKSCMYSRSSIGDIVTPSPTLRKLDPPPKGLAGFGPFMAEDNMIALSVWHDLKLKHRMVPDVALDFLGALDVRGYIDRRARWIRVRKMMTLPATLLEPFTESLVAGIYGAWAFGRLTHGALPGWLFFVLNEVLWLLVDLDVRRNLATNVRHIGPQPTTAAFIAAWAAREILALPIWTYAMLGSTVMWRGNRYRILASGEAKRVD